MTDLDKIYHQHKHLTTNAIVLHEKLNNMGFDEETVDALKTYILWNMRPSLNISEREFDYAKEF